MLLLKLHELVAFYNGAEFFTYWGLRILSSDIFGCVASNVTLSEFSKKKKKYPLYLQ